LTGLSDLWNYWKGVLTNNTQLKANAQAKFDADQTKILAGWTTPRWVGVKEGGTDLWRDADRQPYDSMAAMAMPRHWEHPIGGQHNFSGEGYHIQAQADLMNVANQMLHVRNGA
jgi:hypothetical protein